MSDIVFPMISRTDITVWTISVLLAIGVGWSRYAKWKTRDKLVRELAAMDPDRRGKVLNRLDPKLALEIRQQLMERFRIMS
jgi:flagellar motility protein MotE (MotC chaperone)